jgi:hypothetical protein
MGLRLDMWHMCRQIIAGMALSASDRIILIRTKVERAKKNLHLLEADLTAFRDRKKNVVTSKRDPQTGEPRFLQHLLEF